MTTITEQEYTCPTSPVQANGEAHTIIGCGATFQASPDDEGLVDCPGCGIWFDPDREVRTDPLVWGVTRSEITATAQGSGYVTPITEEQFERIASCISFSTVTECINGALEQVLSYREDA